MVGLCHQESQSSGRGDVMNYSSLQPEVLQGWLVLPGQPLPTQQFPETQACSLPAQLHSPTPQNSFPVYLFSEKQNKSLDRKTSRLCLGFIPALLSQVVPPTPPFGIEAVSSCV